MALTLEWQRRIEHWRREIKNLFYTPLASVELEGFTTYDHLSIKDVRNFPCHPMPKGTQWGAKWEYGWFHTIATLPPECKGHRIILQLGLLGDNYEGEGLVFINGEPKQALDWAHADITLDFHGEPGRTFDIWAESYAGHGPLLVGEGPVPYGKISIPEPSPTQVLIKDSTIGIWNEDIYQLWLDFETLYQIRSYLDINSLRVTEIDEALRKFTTVVDFELPPADMLKTIKNGRELLQPVLACINGSTSPLLYTIGHGHLDVAWLWPLAETERKIGRTIANQLELMSEYPEYKFIQSQAHLFMMLMKYYPDLFKRAVRAIQDGNLIVEGGMWVEADTNLTSGESLVRQFLYGKQYFKEEFGVESELLWLPDVFGYSGALPQIMRGCGIKYFATQKIFWTYNGGDTFPYNLFMWEGIDGSQVLAHIFNNYNSETHPGELNQRWIERVQKDSLSSLVVAFGWGDGGGGPTRNHVEFLRRSANLEGVPRTRMASPVDYFHEMEQTGLPAAKYVGELYFQAHRGTYTSQAKTKKNNRQCEYGLREAEMWASLANSINHAPYPANELLNAWRTVLLLQFHDILPGSSIHRVYEDAEQMHANVLSTVHDLAINAEKTFIRIPDGLTVFNSLSWDRSALVPLPADKKGATTENGQICPSQVIEGQTWIEVKTPSCGWTSMSLCDQANPTEENHLTVTASMLENEHLRVQISEQGEIVSIFDKDIQKELAAGVCNSLKLYKDVPNWFDAWDIDSMYELMPVESNEIAQISVYSQGPLISILRIEKMIGNSLVSQMVSLRQGSRTLIFDTTIDWQENHKLLKVAFPVCIQSNEAVHEIQFGHISRPNHRSRPYDSSRFEVCNHKWTALREENRGCAVLNDCKYGINVLGNCINLTLLKSALSPDMTADRGKQSFTYAFYAWNGPFSESDVVHQGYELNIPVQVITGISGTQSVFKVNQPNIIIDTVKSAEDESGDLILRAYESMCMATDCIINTSLTVAQVFETNMLEENGKQLGIDNHQMKISFKPFEIKTLRIKLF